LSRASPAARAHAAASALHRARPKPQEEAMKFRTSFGGACVAGAIVVACASNPPPQPTTTTGASEYRATPPPSETTTAPSTEQPPIAPTNVPTQATSAFTTDGQIAAYTAAANKAEVGQGKLALRHAKDAEVRAFAQYMIEQHGDAQKKQDKLMATINVTPEATPETTKLEADARSGAVSLVSKTGADFDKAYIDLQVAEHKQVIDMVQNKLIPAAHDADFKRQLGDVLPKLENHLKRAEALQKKLSKM
jgi:putative membrane protein